MMIKHGKASLDEVRQNSSPNDLERDWRMLKGFSNYRFCFNGQVVRVNKHDPTGPYFRPVKVQQRMDGAIVANLYDNNGVRKNVSVRRAVKELFHIDPAF